MPIPASSIPDLSDRHDRGFTLIEALVVLAIVGLIAGLAFPTIERAQSGLALRQARAAAEATIAAARAEALRSGVPAVLGANEAGLTINGRPASAVGAAGRTGPVRIEITTADIRFLPDGSVTGGRVTLVSDVGSTAFVIAPGTGAVASLEGGDATLR